MGPEELRVLREAYEYGITVVRDNKWDLICQSLEKKGLLRNAPLITNSSRKYFPTVFGKRVVKKAGKAPDFLGEMKNGR